MGAHGGGRPIAGYVKAFCAWFSSIGELCDDDLILGMAHDLTDAELRDELLAVRGIGGETADDILYRTLCESELADNGITDLPMTQLPSTSPANAAAKLSRLVDEYSRIVQSSR